MLQTSPLIWTNNPYEPLADEVMELIYHTTQACDRGFIPHPLLCCLHVACRAGQRHGRAIIRDMKRLFMTLTLTLLLPCCGKTELKTVQQQRVGEYTLTILSESGTMKNGSSDFVLEFRRTSDNQLVDVGAVDVAPVMDMSGMAPMMGTDTPGRYQATGTLTMAGLWKFNVKFGSGQSARINVNAE